MIDSPLPRSFLPFSLSLSLSLIGVCGTGGRISKVFLDTPDNIPNDSMKLFNPLSKTMHDYNWVCAMGEIPIEIEIAISSLTLFFLFSLVR
jgi:hypothetical protein